MPTALWSMPATGGSSTQADVADTFWITFSNDNFPVTLKATAVGRPLGRRAEALKQPLCSLWLAVSAHIVHL